MVPCLAYYKEPRNHKICAIYSIESRIIGKELLKNLYFLANYCIKRADVSLFYSKTS